MIWLAEKKIKKGYFNKNNRINLILAIIFFLGGILILRLFYLQVAKNNFFLNKAKDQHDFSSELKPVRGEIFVEDSKDSKTLYPVAANKDFVFIYAIPKDVTDSQKIADNLYNFFREKKVLEEVDKRIEREEKDKLNKDLSPYKNLPTSEKTIKEQCVIDNFNNLLKNPLYLELRTKRKQELINESKNKIISDYLNKLNKKDDVYEPLEKKVEIDEAKSFHLALFNSMATSTIANIESLDVKDGNMVIKNTSKIVNFPGVAYKLVSHRFYPDKNIGSHIIGFVTDDEDNEIGQYGLEGVFNTELSGVIGNVKGEKGNKGTLIINSREKEDKVDGDSLVLTIDRAIQYDACNKLNKAVDRYKADGGSVIIMDPKTGAIIAMCSAPDFDPNDYRKTEDIRYFNNPAIFNAYEPGSVFKAITMAAALDQGKVQSNTTYLDKGEIMIDGWPKPIRNSDFETVGGHGVVPMTTVLEYSLNTGAIFAMQKIGEDIFADYVKRFGFGEKTGIELQGEVNGNISNLTAKKKKKIDFATASFGQGIMVTPLQMVTSYAAIANGGTLVKPYLVKKIIHADGSELVTNPNKGPNVISPETSKILSAMLVRVIEDGHGQKMKIPGYYIAGKTGTAQVANKWGRGYGNSYMHTFITFLPANNPRFVLLTKLDQPRTYKFADSTTLPLARDIAEFLTNYLEIPKERE